MRARMIHAALDATSLSPALLLLSDGVDELWLDLLVQHALRLLDSVVEQDRHVPHEHTEECCGSVVGVDSRGLYRCRHGHLVPKTCQHMLGAYSVSYNLVQGYQVPRTLLLGGETCRSSQDHLYWELLGRPHSTLGVSSGGRTAGPAGQTLLPEGSDCCCCHPA